MKKGATPSHTQRRPRPDRTGRGGGSETTPGGSSSSASITGPRCLDAGDLFGPLLLQDRRRRLGLVGGGELHGRVLLGGRELVQELLRDHAARRQVVEAHRVRVPLQPQELAFVRVQELLPQPRREGMW